MEVKYVNAPDTEKIFTEEQKKDLNVKFIECKNRIR